MLKSIKTTINLDKETRKQMNFLQKNSINISHFFRESVRKKYNQMKKIKDD